MRMDEELIGDRDSGVPTESQPSGLIATYLRDRDAEYCRRTDLCQKGWDNPRADQYFARQRHNADQATLKTAKYFYSMMQGIAKDMDLETQALRLTAHGSNPPLVLDFCAAPGGFLSVVLNVNPTARAQAFSLPAIEGGHQMLMPETKRADIDCLDITMLAGDMGVENISTSHPDFRSFLERRLEVTQKFDLILCDGKVLRKHKRAGYRAKCEPQRLTAVQLALGLRHVRQGGTMIILLHELNAWDTVATIFRFSRFSSIRLFKPQRSHATRSSFYLIATDVRSDHVEALTAGALWKDVWSSATFPGVEGLKSVTDGLDINQVLGEFGQTLLALGRPIWSIQANALAGAPFMKNT